MYFAQLNVSKDLSLKGIVTKSFGDLARAMQSKVQFIASKNWLESEVDLMSVEEALSKTDLESGGRLGSRTRSKFKRWGHGNQRFILTVKKKRDPSRCFAEKSTLLMATWIDTVCARLQRSSARPRALTMMSNLRSWPCTGLSIFFLHWWFWESTKFYS